MTINDLSCMKNTDNYGSKIPGNALSLLNFKSDSDLTLCVWGLTFEKGRLLSLPFFHFYPVIASGKT